VSIDGSGKDLLELTGMGAVDCGFISRPTHYDVDKNATHR
jgi:hypothetical protein